MKSYIETDPVFGLSVAKTISTTNISNWNSAFGWGNHAGLYRSIGYVPAWSDLTSTPFSFTSVQDDQILKYNSTSDKWENWTPDFSTGSTETDPVFAAWNKSSGISISSSQDSDFQEIVTNNPAVLANTAKNSYPVADAVKLAGIAPGAEVNVNADWNATNGDAVILNKPTIPTQYTDVMADARVVTGITGKVDKVAGKGLSTEDYSTAEKNKLTAISGTNTGDNAINSNYSDLVTNATHTGEVTGSGVLTIANKVTMTATLPVSITGNPSVIATGSVAISIAPSTPIAAGSMSSVDKTKLDGITGTNTGDETASTIKTKLGITTLSGSNTGDQDGSETKVKAGTNVAVTGTGTTANPYVVNATSGGSSTHTIGESFGGGIVFYVYDNGQHGLIAATADQSTGIRWYGGSFTNTRARADGIGAGLKNTAIIIATQVPFDGNAFAATLCNEYLVTVGGVTYGDWYLPSKYELNLLYLQKSVVGGFASSEYYWSSSEINLARAWLQFFYNGYQDDAADKDGVYYVRAIRAF
jgi:hypothetical protein